MPVATNIEDLRRGIGELGLEQTLGDPDAIDEINEALESDNVEKAKAGIAETLRGLQATSLGGFPLGVELDLVELVGFDD